MRKLLLILVIAALASSICSGCASKNYAPLETASNVDLNRYAGTWYEVYSLPNYFQSNCVATKAEYSLNTDGTVKVTNSCRDKTFDGPVRQVEGKAWVVAPPDNSKLKVQFFWPFKGDYWILDLDPDYRFVLIGNPARKYFWVLSRTPVLDQAILTRLLEHAQKAGFDVAKGRPTPQLP